MGKSKKRKPKEPLPIGSKLRYSCPECGSGMVLRDSWRGLFYGCERFPDCRCAHGAHPDGRPLGIPADKETKKFRMKAHDWFDRLWRSERMTRKEAYMWMRETMFLTRSQAHIGKFDKKQCMQLIACVQYDFPDLENWSDDNDARESTYRS